MIKNIIFDLDGTLLPMDADLFVKYYFKAAFKNIKMPLKTFEEFQNVMMKSVYLMVNNDGSRTNEEVLIEYFKEVFKDKCQEVLDGFNRFYQNEFIEARVATMYAPLANLIIQELVSKGYKVILATNPLFPRVCTYERMRWAGLDPKDFLHVTTYENSSYSKPNLKYYEEIITKLNLNKDECLMVGNDTSEDYCITELGINCVILKDCLINKKKLEIDFTTLKDFYNACKNYPSLK